MMTYNELAIVMEENPDMVMDYAKGNTNGFTSTQAKDCKKAILRLLEYLAGDDF